MYSMGLDTELEFEKYCKVVWNPKVGRRLRYDGLKSAEKVENMLPASRAAYPLRSVDDESKELRFGKSRSSSHKSIAYGSAEVSNNRVLKMDPLYKVSEESINARKMGVSEERKKIELSYNGDDSLSFRIFDALTASDIASPLVDKRISPLTASRADEIPSPAFKCFNEPATPDSFDLSFRFPSTPDSITGRNLSSDEFFSISTESEDGDQLSAGTIERHSIGAPELQLCQTVGPLNEGNGPLGRNRFRALHKSSSVNVRMANAPFQSESNQPGQKTRFSPFRKMLNPIIKSKSMRSLSASAAELGNVTTPGKNIILHKSLRHAFSNVSNKKESDVQLIKKDLRRLVTLSSPGHLNGLLTVGVKHEVPYFEFSVGDVEELLSAKTWKANNTRNWVYTFHSMSKRGNNNSRWGSKERCKEPAMVGQMQVSCFLLSEMRNGGIFYNSTMTEFVLYDIANARRNMAVPDGPYCSSELVIPSRSSDEESLVSRSSQIEANSILSFMNQKLRNKDTSCDDEFDVSTHYPWSPADLHPNSEIAAIVIQMPLEKRESLKEKPAENLGDKQCLNILDSYANDHKNEKAIRQPNVKVVTPLGTHGLPGREEVGSPSSLLDRWRSGGHCDCGGWDMACPLVVFDGLTVQSKEEDRYKDVEQPMKLFFEGAKERVPALTMTSIGVGQYSVDFHARLSKLQAFSICVAILHSSEASTACGLESEQESLRCNSLKLLLNEEMRCLVGAVGEKER